MSQMSIATVPNSTDKSTRLDFEEIFRQYSPMIYRAAYAVTGSRQDADDVLQTVFLKLIRREYPPDLKANPKAYLHRAAVNMSLDVIRNRRRYTAAEDFEHLEAPRPRVTLPVEDELQTRLNDVLTRLEPEAAHILVLRYVHDYSDAEISKMLGTSRGAIALRLFRLRARLKKLLRVPYGEKS
jgi:RNA polymerase sigma-70 factor (ECF subfamily)